MDLEEIRHFCLQKQHVTESFPFDKSTLVFKVFDKMFLLVDLDSFPIRIAVKGDPEEIIELKEKYDFISSAPHFNKKYWINITLEKYLDADFIRDQIEKSYSEVLKKIPKKTLNKLYI